MNSLRTLNRFSHRGVTLVELIISIAIIAIGVAGTLLAINQTVRSSADPMVIQQSIAIAEAYLAEITSKSFSEDAVNGVPETYGPLGTNGETRPVFDDVDDYIGTDVGARGQDNIPIAGLGGYTVNVAVSYAALNNITVAPGDAKLILVTVTGPTSAVVQLSGYRTNY